MNASKARQAQRAKHKPERAHRKIKPLPPLDRDKWIDAMWIPSGLPHYR